MQIKIKVGFGENLERFLAAMSSSRSDEVTQCVCMFVPFFSFSVFGVCSTWVFQGSFKGVLRKFKGCCKEFSGKFQGFFKDVS